MYKYPRTKHIESSSIQKDDIKETMLVSNLTDLVIIEEKMDGANCGISFDNNKLLLQSRGHYLNGGPREKQFELFKSWAMRWKNELFKIIGNKYIMYGEWLYAKHTIYYDFLPHYFMEFDIFDYNNEKFLSTLARINLLKNSPIESVKVISTVKSDNISLDYLWNLIGESSFKSKDWKTNIKKECNNRGINYDLILKQTQNDNFMEGLYIKTEKKDKVTGRFKLVRSQFLSLVNSESHWLSRPIIPNKLMPNKNIF